MREVDWQSAEEYRSWVDHLLYGSDILLKSKCRIPEGSMASS